jgi:hypothetical protein
MVRIAIVVIGWLACVGACTPEREAAAPSAAHSGERTPPPEPAPSDPVEAKGGATGKVGATVARAKVEAADPPAPALGRDHLTAVPCKSDADCGWDDPCMPSRCVESTPNVGCDKSLPPPGTCRCLDERCTLEPQTIPEPRGTCEMGGCVVDRAAGRCVADTGDVAPNLRFTPPVEVGPSCDCQFPAKGCTFSWFSPVACKSDRDCWVSPSPRTHPIARPKALRGRDFKPCKDGETPPKCGPTGTCVLGPAYSC